MWQLNFNLIIGFLRLPKNVFTYLACTGFGENSNEILSTDYNLILFWPNKNAT